MTGRLDPGPGGPPPPELDRLVATPLEHRWLHRSWGRQHVALAGPEGAPPLLLVHGWPQHWLCWRRVAPALAADRRVAMVDLRGLGWSQDRTGQRPTIKDMARDLVRTLDDLDVDQATLVGHDWGGWLAFVAALASPERVRQVVGVAITPPWLDTKGVVRHLPVLSYTFLLASIGDRLVRSPRALPAMLRRNSHVDAWADPDGATVLRTYQERIARRSAGRTTKALYGELVGGAAWRAGRQRPDRLAMPGAIVLGEHEKITTTDLFLPATLPDELQLRTVAGAGHWVPEEQPDALVEVLQEVLGAPT